MLCLHHITSHTGGGGAGDLIASKWFAKGKIRKKKQHIAINAFYLFIYPFFAVFVFSKHMIANWMTKKIDVQVFDLIIILNHHLRSVIIRMHTSGLRCWNYSEQIFHLMLWLNNPWDDIDLIKLKWNENQSQFPKK